MDVAAHGVAEGNQTSCAATFGSGEATFEVTDGGAVGSDAASVLAIGRPCSSACSHSGEEVIGHREPLLAHGGGRGEVEAAVSERETNVRKAVVASALEVLGRLVVEEATTASSGRCRRIAGRRGGGLYTEILSDGVTTCFHAGAFGPASNE